MAVLDINERRVLRRLVPAHQVAARRMAGADIAAVGRVRELVGRGLEVPYPPTKRVYDRTEIEVTDCDGHKLVFGE